MSLNDSLALESLNWWLGFAVLGFIVFGAAACFAVRRLMQRL